MVGTGLEPRWASAPGATIAATLLERSVTHSDFAELIGLGSDDVERLLEGDLSITLDLARRLADVVGASPTFWLTREAQYLEDRARVEADQWSQGLPITQMASFGWVEKPTTWQERIAVSLDFFGVSDVESWSRRYDHQVSATHYRTSPSFDLESPATTVWFRAAERVVEGREPLPTFDPLAFAATLPDVRHLTRQRDPNVFIPQLVDLVAESGVHVVVVRAPSGCPASGASRTYNGHPLIQLSARHLTDDHFWFTFFHEAGHVVSHELDKGFIDIFDADSGDRFEQEANDFARECLLGPHGVGLSRVKGRPWSHRDVVREAANSDIAPGILVGQLQHAGIVPNSHLNRLKRRYVWSTDRLLAAKS